MMTDMDIMADNDNDIIVIIINDVMNNMEKMDNYEDNTMEEEEEYENDSIEEFEIPVIRRGLKRTLLSRNIEEEMSDEDNESYDQERKKRRN